MEHLITVKIPATEQQVIEKVTCDLCDADIATLHGKSYVGSLSSPNRGVDICRYCFDTKLLPWIESQQVEKITTNKKRSFLSLVTGDYIK